jgi:hypothetical protein
VLVHRNDLVERVGNLAVETGPITGQTDRKIAITNGLEDAQELAGVLKSGGSREWSEGVGLDGMHAIALHGRGTT